MNVQQIYEKYQIPPNLQKHMLRVASLAQIILENWQGKEVDKNSIITACLFHDMANVIKFNLDKPSLFKEEGEQIEYWKKVQKEYIEKYGTDVHKATLTIGKEIGLSKKVLRIIKNLEWDNTKKLLAEKDLESLFPIYCDMRIGPFGIMSLEERINNLKIRTQSRDFSEIIKSAIQLGHTLQKNIQIDLNNIDDKKLNEKFTKLLINDV